MINFIIAYGLSLAILIFIIISAGSIIFSVLSFAPWVPSRTRDLKRIFKLADLRPGQIFYDLGCGDGKIVIYAAKTYGVKAIGLEISLPFYIICLLRQAFNKPADIKFKFKNLHKENLSAADVIYFFSIPHALTNDFLNKLKRELRPGAKVISYSFKLPGWAPSIIDKPTEKDLPVYLYEM